MQNSRGEILSYQGRSEWRGLGSRWSVGARERKESTMTEALSLKITGAWKVPLTQLGNRPGAGRLVERLFWTGLTKFMGLVSHHHEDVQKVSHMQEFVSNMRCGRHLTMLVISCCLTTGTFKAKGLYVPLTPIYQLRQVFLITSHHGCGGKGAQK